MTISLIPFNIKVLLIEWYRNKIRIIKPIHNIYCSSFLGKDFLYREKYYFTRVISLRLALFQIILFNQLVRSTNNVPKHSMKICVQKIYIGVVLVVERFLLCSAECMAGRLWSLDGRNAEEIKHFLWRSCMSLDSCLAPHCKKDRVAVWLGERLKIIFTINQF